jgi:glycosyltransferase involved in cell wall biosynthesis
MITNALPHKNTALAAQAFAASEAAMRGVSLRVVGSIDPAGLAACRSAGVNVEMRRGVSDADLYDWLADAEFLLSPSLDEGLNLPVAEALAQGGRILCSDIAVHREFYDGQASFFDPRSIDGMILALNKALALDRGEWPRRTVPAGPSFADVASQYRALFLRLASAR